MHVDVIGPAEAAGGEPVPDLVLLHGGIGTGSYHWGRQAEALSDRFRVHLPDLPGHGGTPAPEGPYTRRVLVDAVRDYLDSLDGRVHVGGFSMGGHTALALCADEPERFASLMLIGVSVASHDGLGAWRRRFDPDALEEAYPLWAKQLSRLHRELGGPEAWREVALRDSGGLDVDVDVSRLEQLEAPVLLIRGDRDSVVDPEQYARMREAWPQAEEAVVPAGQHDVQLTRSGVVRCLLADFYERVLEG